MDSHELDQAATVTGGLGMAALQAISAASAHAALTGSGSALGVVLFGTGAVAAAPVIIGASFAASSVGLGYGIYKLFSK